METGLMAFFIIVIGLVLALVFLKVGVWILKILGNLAGIVIKGLLIVVGVVGLIWILGVVAGALA